MLILFGFYLLAALAVAAGLFLVLTRNLLHAVLALALASLAVAGLLLALPAEFIAWVLVLVYVGAVVVLGIFAVMLTGHFDRPLVAASRSIKAVAVFLSLGLILLLGGVALIQPATSQKSASLMQVSGQDLGHLLLTEYVLPFELVSILLLATLIGAIRLKIR